jgi:hypothetical protein
MPTWLIPILESMAGAAVQVAATPKQSSTTPGQGTLNMSQGAQSAQDQQARMDQNQRATDPTQNPNYFLSPQGGNSGANTYYLQQLQKMGFA